MTADWVTDHAAALNEIHRLRDVIERTIEDLQTDKPSVIRAYLERDLEDK